MHAHNVPHAEHVWTSTLLMYCPRLRCEEMAKQCWGQLKDFDDISGVTHSSPHAKLCGVSAQFPNEA